MSLKCIPKHEISKMHLSDIVTKMIKFSTPGAMKTEKRLDTFSRRIMKSHGSSQNETRRARMASALDGEKSAGCPMCSLVCFDSVSPLQQQFAPLNMARAGDITQINDHCQTVKTRPCPLLSSTESTHKYRRLNTLPHWHCIGKVVHSKLHSRHRVGN